MILTVIAWIASTARVFSLTPTDDVWVYPHASEPERDAYLRVWGSDGLSVAKAGASPQNFSYGYLKFDVSNLPAGTLQKATLVLTHVADPAWTPEIMKQYPLEARRLSPKFGENTWTYADSSTIFPGSGKESIYGLASRADRQDQKDFALSIELGDETSAFGRDLKKAIGGAEKQIAIALTSAMDPEVLGMKCVYKVYSKEGPKSFRPILKLEWMD